MKPAHACECNCQCMFGALSGWVTKVCMVTAFLFLLCYLQEVFAEFSLPGTRSSCKRKVCSVAAAAICHLRNQKCVITTDNRQICQFPALPSAFFFLDR
mmetsp:Transcript_46531/g.75741  ORF Transcript_46531/g.75741 Transcript_46531/m.75741 type:complete len:99 (-) Transcript_46531:4-300(-)